VEGPSEKTSPRVAVYGERPGVMEPSTGRAPMVDFARSGFDNGAEKGKPAKYIYWLPVVTRKSWE
jgi:hypothetical protein